MLLYELLHSASNSFKVVLMGIEYGDQYFAEIWYEIV